MHNLNLLQQFRESSILQITFLSPWNGSFIWDLSYKRKKLQGKLIRVLFISKEIYKCIQNLLQQFRGSSILQITLAHEKEVLFETNKNGRNCKENLSVSCLSVKKSINVYRKLRLEMSKNLFGSPELKPWTDSYQISYITSIGRGMNNGVFFFVFFSLNRIRTLVAIATYSCHWLIMGKLKIGIYCYVTAGT